MATHRFSGSFDHQHPARTSSGHVLAASGGRFRLDHWHQGQTIDLGPGPLEELVRRWDELG